MKGASMMSDDTTHLPEWLARYGELSQEYQRRIAPIKAQMKSLEVAMEDATAELSFEMATLESLIKHAVLALQQTQKVPFVTAIYSRKDQWDSEMLFAFAKEQPAVLQAHSEVSTVSL